MKTENNKIKVKWQDGAIEMIHLLFFFFFFRSQSRLGQTVPQQTLKTPMAKEMMREINGFRYMSAFQLSQK